MSGTGGVEGPGLGSDNGGDNDSGGTDTSNDVDTSTTQNDDTDTDPDANGKVDKPTTVEETVEDTVRDVVDSIMDAIESITGVDIPDDVRAAISNKISEYAEMTVSDVVTDIIEMTLAGLGVPAAAEIAESIVKAIKDPTATLDDLRAEITQHLANAGLNQMNMNPVARAIVENFVNLADPDFGFADLMGNIAAIGFTVAAHGALGALSLGSGNMVAAAAISKGADWVNDTVNDHVAQAEKNGDVVNAGEEGYDVSHGPGHDKSEIEPEPVLVT